jgi:hypothetical protein
MNFTRKITGYTLLAATLLSAPMSAALAALDANEETHLTFMREEEKLARDVYLSLADMYPNATVFQNIAMGSEQTHTDTMRDKLAQFNLTDPNPDTNNLPASIGVFTGTDYGSYFTEKFNLLVNWGSNSELDALYAGAFIEELDMHDIVLCPSIVKQLKGYGDNDCGLGYTDSKPLINSYNSLLDGSESHLRSYVGQIEAIIGVGNYQAQYLSQATVDEILGR